MVYVSFVNVAEIQSLAFQNRWGETKMQRLVEFLQTLRIIEISELLLTPMLVLTHTANEITPIILFILSVPPAIWAKTICGRFDASIAATASLLNLQLVTTDGDFDHLDQTFLSLKKVLPKEISLS